MSFHARLMATPSHGRHANHAHVPKAKVSAKAKRVGRAKHVRMKLRRG